MKYLESVYDPQEYSIWKVTFKYPEELTQGKLFSKFRVEILITNHSLLFYFLFLCYLFSLHVR